MKRSDIESLIEILETRIEINIDSYTVPGPTKKDIDDISDRFVFEESKEMERLVGVLKELIDS